jgi:hypothetical protein
MLEQATNRKLIAMKSVANAHIKHCERPYTIRKIKILLDKLILIKEIDRIQKERNLLGVQAFYSTPVEIRDKKLNRFLSKWYDEYYHGN